ncbi:MULTISPECIES: N-6 DNA methylase [Shewanella]|uniref:site-specific DNA-methyltransferase (adenine-specific) n=1 Tax=Shewanella indica TaxID=768528 RepID=A0ABU4QDX1_9GAMM|nr:N-6 DNA methylase [Shewanella indica]MDX6017218.1 N-6 DNA methylase [Shewanella indica]
MVELNQYYTPILTSEYLASLLNLDNIRTCVELSAGEGALIEPIKKINPNITFTTVDIDPRNTEKLYKLYPKDNHFCDDALNANLCLPVGYYDLAICNPPFSTVPFGNDLDFILDNDFYEIFKSFKTVRTEVLFILKNLSLLKDGGVLAILVPSLIVNYSRLDKFRRLLFGLFELESVVEFEYKSFKKTEAKVFILVIRKSRPALADYMVGFTRYFNGVACKKDVYVSSLFHKSSTSEYLAGFKLFRGSNSSKECRGSFKEFYHNYAWVGDFSNVKYSSCSSKLPNVKYAISGDILIHRVGRQVGRTVFLTDGQVVVSDCIIVLRFFDNALKEKFIEFWKENKSQWISEFSKGTCAKSISIRDISALIRSL